MGFFSKTDKGQNRIALFDIGSASVGGAVVVLQKNKNPKIIFEVRKQMPFQENLEAGRFTDGMLSTLEKVSLEVQKEGGRVRDVYCVYSSPWYLSQTKSVKEVREKPMVVTESSIEEVIKREGDAFKESKLARESGGAINDARLVEKMFIEIKLNGYRTNNPFGKKAKDIEVTVFMSVIPGKILKSVERTINKAFHFGEIYHHSFALSAFTVLRDIYSAIENFLFVDISGEVTDASLVREGVLIKTATFPKGKNYLLRGLSSSLKTIPEEALSSVRMHGEGMKEEDSEYRAGQAMSQVSEIWLDELRETFTGLSGGVALPRTIFFTADKEVTKIFMELMQGNALSGTTPSEGNYDVVPLDGSAMREFCDCEDGVVYDPFLAIGAMFASRLNDLAK